MTVLKTDLVRARVKHDGMFFNCVQLSTTALTEIAVDSQEKGQPASMKRTFIEMVTSWENVEVSPKVDMECTDENKAAIYECNHELIQELLPKMQAAIARAVKDQKKI